ncbi:MAG TPA: glycosyltransferase [Nitrospirota bacterium]
MRILLSVPNHLRTVPMGRFVFETMKTMGHTVHVCNFGAQGFPQKVMKGVSKPLFLDYKDKMLKEAVEGLKPELFLSIFGFDHRADVLRDIRSMGVVTACWWLNDPFQVSRSLAQAGLYEYYFTNSKGSVPEYNAAGHDNVFYMPVAAYPPVHSRGASISKIYDVCFAGDHSPLREAMLGELGRDFDLAIFGPWGKKLGKGSPLRGKVVKDGFFEPEEMARIFNQSRVVLNIHTWLGKSNHGTNPRLFEANGCGSFQLCDYKTEIPELYEPDKEIVLYNCLDELKEKLSYYLSHDAEREEIAENGYRRTMMCHTYERRVEDILSICAGSVRGDKAVHY